MSQSWERLCWGLSFSGGLAIVGVVATGSFAVAQVIPDATLGAESSVVTPNLLIRGALGDRIDGGATRGVNLFHSFSQFNVGENQRLYFANPAGIANILSRVTGADPSRILGTLGVDGAANLYLINPQGILFGTNARLDVSGSFVASTAERLVFGNGLAFSATNPEAPPLLTINLRPGLQYGATPGTIANAGNLAVGQDLTLAAGNLDLQGQLRAGGALTLRATDTLRVRDNVAAPFIASAGGQLVAQGDRAVDIFALNHPSSGFFAGGDLVLRSAGPIGGDAYYTTGGNFRIEQLDGSLGGWFSPYDPVIRATGNVSFTDYTGASLHIFAGGSVTANSITIDNADVTNFINQVVPLSDGTSIAINGSLRPTLDIRAGTTAVGTPGLTGAPAPTGLTAPGTALTADIAIGNIAINVPDGLVFLTNRYQPNPALSGDITVGDLAAGGLINLIAAGQSGTIVIDSRGAINVNTGIITATGPFFGVPPGNAGAITLLANGNINLPDGAFLYSGGDLGGRITLTSNATIAITGNGDFLGFGFPVMSDSLGGAAGTTGGDIRITGQVLSISNSAGIITRTLSPANAGNVFLTGRDAINLNASAVQTAPVAAGTGNSGNLTVTTRSLSLLNSSTLASQTSTSGNAGNIVIDTSGGSVLLDNGSQIASRVNAGASGRAGDVTITTQALTATNGSSINAFTQGSGNAGNVTVNATGSVLLSGVRGATASSIVTTVATGATGRAGNATVTAQSLTVTDGGQIRTSTRGVQNAGNVSINADTITFDGVSSSGIVSGIASEVLPGGTGNGGDIAIRTRRLSLTNGAAISANTNSAIATSTRGNAGIISIDASDTVSFDGIGRNGINTAARVSTFGPGQGGRLTVRTGTLSLTNGGQLRSNTSGAGNAGDIEVIATNAVLLAGNNSGLFASTNPGSTGNGGRIVIDPPLVSLRDSARISVDSRGQGTGGDIQIQAGLLTLDNRSIISADTASNTGGNIQLSVRDILLLRRNSRISTNAGTALAGGNGGNIGITVPFLVAAPLENSDITANAFSGSGGSVTINAQNIFWMVPRSRAELSRLLGTNDPILLDPGRLPTNDITAISQQNPSLNGVVTINTPNVDPSKGLATLPVNLVDASSLVAQNCAADRGVVAQQQGEFIITGRGGLPPSPSNPLNSAPIWQDLRSPTAPSNQVSQPSVGNAAEQTSVRPEAIVEAQTWVIQPYGGVILTAQADTATPQTAWLTPANCQRP